jgi:Mg2+/citrate symporter
MYRRVMPAIVALPCMALLMMLVTGVPVVDIPGLIVKGTTALAPVYVTVIFGALLARVTLDTGIARALVNLAAEYGGEQPLVLALLLSAVVAVLFVSLSGLGAIIMVGSIVLPIMMTTGVPRAVAATLFLMAFALGFIFNLTNWRFYTQLFGVVPQQMTHYAVLLAIIDAIALVIYAVVSLARARDYATWAVQVDDEPPAPRVPAIALATPLLPIALYFALHLDPTISFIVAAIFGAVVTRGTRTVETLVAAAIRGVEDVAPAVLLFIGIGMLFVATQEPQFQTAVRPLVQGWANNPVAYVAIFGLGSPLVLYRGPLNPFGVGIAVFTVLLATHALPPVVLVAAVMAVVQVQNVCDPTNTANVWVANFTGTPIDTISKRTLPYQVAVATLAVAIVALASPQLFGVRAFASLRRHLPRRAVCTRRRQPRSTSRSIPTARPRRQRRLVRS